MCSYQGKPWEIREAVLAGEAYVHRGLGLCLGRARDVQGDDLSQRQLTRGRPWNPGLGRLIKFG